METLRKYTCQACLSLVLLLLTAPAQAQEPVTFEPSFPNLEFEFPAEIQNAADGSDRLFVVEQSGRIKVFDNDENTSQQKTFLDLSNVVSFSSGQEIGLLGLAFHPDYSDNGYFYVYHTRSSSVPGVRVELVLARYQVSEDNPDEADASSRLEIFSFDKNQGTSNHNGGKIAFGPDGYLYASLGDGGGGGDPERNAQNLDNVFGSILRIDVDLDGSNPLENNPDTPNGNYEIPSDNPRVGQSGLDELYAWGVRNTWKFSFDTATDRIWAGDVGQGEREEINLLKSGANYGWNRFEGNRTFRSATDLVTTPDTKPIFEYDHNNGDVSITGGYVYRGASNNTNIKGKYIYGDYVSGRIWSLDYNKDNGTASSTLLFRTNGENVSSFGLDESGELYFSGYGSSAQLFKIVGGDDQSPSITDIEGVGNWEEVAGGTDGIVNAVTVDGSSVYVAGSFGNAGNIAASNIAVYTEDEGWSALAGGSNGDINALAVDEEGRLYAGGNFSSIGGIDAENIAVWDGTLWTAIGGTDGPVARLGIDNEGVLFVGGAFAAAGGVTVNNIARYDGDWSALTDSGTGESGTNNEIRAIAFDDSNVLYVGGNFDTAGGNTANRIATYDGSVWGTLGAGTSGFVQAIAITEESIFAGGNFALAGGETVNRIASWNRSAETWETLGNGVSGNVNALVHDGTYLYAGGNFETASPDATENYRVNNVARWSTDDGWEALGTGTDVGTDNQLNTLAFSTDQNNLYAGGNFQDAGNVEASSLAVWSSGSSSSTCAIVPYTNLNNEGWNSVAEAAVNEGDQVRFGPQTEAFGTATGEGWSWTGPNGYTSNLREIRLADTEADQAGTYTVTNTDNTGCTASLDFVLEVTGNLAGIPDGAIFEMQPQHNKNLRLDVRGENPANSTLVDGYRRTGNANQQWKFISRGDDLYEIEPQHAVGQRLDVAGRSSATNTEIHIYKSTGNSNQLWKAIPVGNDGLYRFQPQNALARRLDIENVNGVPRALSRTFDGGNSQRWRLIPVTNGNTSLKIDDLSTTANISLSPNPTSGYFTVTITGLDVRNVGLYTISGQQLYSKAVEESTTQLQIEENLSPGMYLVEFTNADGTSTTKKILVE